MRMAASLEVYSQLDSMDEGGISTGRMQLEQRRSSCRERSWMHEPKSLLLQASA